MDMTSELYILNPVVCFPFVALVRAFLKYIYIIIHINLNITIYFGMVY